MIQRFRLNCVYILVLSILLRSSVSYCHPEFVKDTSSNTDANVYTVEDQRNRVDPLIEKIFRAPSERRNDAINSKCNIETETGKAAVQAEDASKNPRVKRDNVVKKSNSRSLNEAAKTEEKRSIPRKVAKVTSRIGRSSRESAKLPDKDYEVPVDQDKSEYGDEAEEESALNSKKETRYKGSETRSSEDSAGFIDQEERSSLYDDFETKDVVKRGISGAEDYEEMDEEGIGGAEDSASLEDNSLGEEAEKRIARGDVRVKREYENSREAETAEVAGKPESSGTSADSGDSKAAETPLKRDSVSEKDNKVVESQVNKADKESSDQEENSKRNVPEKNESDMSKLNSGRETDGSKQSLMANDQTEMESGESGKLQNQEGQQIAGEGKPQEISLSGTGKVVNDLVSDSSDLKGTSKAEESKITDVANQESAKVDVPANVAETVAAEVAEKLENSKKEPATVEQLDGDYQKRVEERIQRKIDSIKEEIKREIAEKRRIRDIEENNAKFDELHEQEDDDGEEQALQAEPADKRDMSKRSVRNGGKVAVRDKAEKRSIKRKKRQGDNGPEKVQGANEANSNKKSRQTKKRSTTKSQAPIVNEAPIKRQYPREIFLVRSDRKKKRRRRSKNANPMRDQRTAKLEDSLPGDIPVALGNGKTSARKAGEDERTMAGHESMLERRSGSVASLTGSNEESGPLATEYGDAFGGLNSEPGVALARFKRIKRVLRPPTSKMKSA